MKSGNRKLFKSIRGLVYLLRKLFPDRFAPNADEFVIAVGSGDYPYVRMNKLPHTGVAPVLMFGSSFRNEGVYSNLIPMPMPDARHLDCFVEYVEKGRVCMALRDAAGGGEEKWDDLIVSCSRLYGCLFWPGLFLLLF